MKAPSFLVLLLVPLLAGTAAAEFGAGLFETGGDTVRTLRAADLDQDGTSEILAFADELWRQTRRSPG